MLDSIIQVELVPALFNTTEVMEELDQLFQLPVKQGGLGIVSPRDHIHIECQSLGGGNLTGVEAQPA
eukprot:11633810-Ditylum_brightwellii.AAC.1